MTGPNVDEVRERTGPCHSPGCGHTKQQHQDPVVREGRCLVTGCDCIGWDPMTGEEWAAVLRGAHL